MMLLFIIIVFLSFHYLFIPTLKVVRRAMRQLITSAIRTMLVGAAMLLVIYMCVALR